MSRATALVAAALVLASLGCQQQPELSTVPPLGDTLRLMADAAGSDQLLSMVVVANGGQQVVSGTFRVGSHVVELRRNNADAVEERPQPLVTGTSSSFSIPIDAVDETRISQLGATSCPEPVVVHLIALPGGRQQLLARCKGSVVAEQVDGSPLVPVQSGDPASLVARLREGMELIAPGDQVDGIRIEVTAEGPLLRAELAMPVGTTFTGAPCRPTVTLAPQHPALSMGCHDMPASSPQPTSILDETVVTRIWEQALRPAQWTLSKVDAEWRFKTGEETTSYSLEGDKI